MLRYDSLLVHHLAAELDVRLKGRTVLGLTLRAAARRATLELRREALVLELHPRRGWIWMGPRSGHDRTPRTVAGLRRVPLRRTVVGVVRAPFDERLVLIDLQPRDTGDPGAGGGTGIFTLVIELMTNQLNLLALDGARRIVAALWPRDAGGRSLRPGDTYATPPSVARMGPAALDPAAWRRLLESVPPPDRTAALIQGIAWTSPINAAPMLGEAAGSDDAAALDRALARYRTLAPPAAPRPVILRGEPQQPYPFPLPGIESEPAGSLLDAMATVAAAPAAAETGTDAALALVDARIARGRRRLERLRQQLAGAREKARIYRAQADLLLAHVRDVPRGARSVLLPDFEGGEVRVELDPALSAVRNADRLYDRARRRQRAATKLPAMLARAEAEQARLAQLRDDVAQGTTSGESARAALGAPVRRGGRRQVEPARPFRVYRTSNGLEVRVGRGARANDDLTFHHSAPDDVWLHARDTAGAHVILRWSDREAGPPARDLAEAAALAALHSKARTSATVPVDWTRRKYVRKPRKAPPGRVVADRLRTIFVEPDAALDARLRVTD